MDGRRNAGGGGRGEKEGRPENAIAKMCGVPPVRAQSVSIYIYVCVCTEPAKR